MDEMFKNLKETLNETVLKDIDFGEKSKEKVRRAINIKEKRKVPWKPILNNLLRIAATCLLFIGTGYFIAEQLRTFSSQDHLTSKNNMKNEGMQEQTNGSSHTDSSSNNDKVEAVSPQEVHKVSQIELDKAAEDIGEIKTVQDLVTAMITLTAQKLEIKGEENYRIPNTAANIKRIQFNRANLQYLKNRAVAVNASNLYQETLDKWLKGDFSKIEYDFLSIRNDPSELNESIVKKVRTAEEEQKYIEHFFGNEGLEINKRDWQ